MIRIPRPRRSATDFEGKLFCKAEHEADIRNMIVRCVYGPKWKQFLNLRAQAGQPGPQTLAGTGTAVFSVGKLGLRNIVGSIPATLCVLGFDGYFQYISPEGSRLLGYSEEEFASLSLLDLVHPRDRRRVKYILLEHIPTGRSTLEGRFLCKSGEYKWLFWETNTVPDNSYACAVIHDITDRKEREGALEKEVERVTHDAYHDGLTGLPNRRKYEMSIQSAIQRAREYHHLCGLILIDLNGFKTINDTQGHDVGDLLLKEIAKRLRKCVREPDMPIRWGGDEFAVIVSHFKSPADIAEIAERLAEEIARDVTIEEESFRVSASIGVAIYPVDGGDENTLFACADGRMYSMKGR